MSNKDRIITFPEIMYSLENNVENCLIQFLISSNAFLKRDAGNYIPN
jgi:hypothetical protein